MIKIKTSGGAEVTQLLAGRSNVFLIKHITERFVMVDTSVPMVRRRLLRALKYEGVNRIEYIILTHSHYDHVGNAKHIRRYFDSQTVAHRYEAMNIRKGEMDIPRGTYSVIKDVIDIINSLNFAVFYEPCNVDHEVTDIWWFKGLRGIDIIHTPGHSLGSMSVIVDHEVAIVGDTMVNALLFNVFPPFADDVELLLKSWQSLLDTGCYIFLPSHGGPITREELKKALDKWKKKKLPIKPRRWSLL